MRDYQFTADPRVGYASARARNNIGATYNNPVGAYSTPAIQDAALRAMYEDNGQQEAQAFREENYARQGLDYARTADVAAMTQPRLVQESQSGTSSGTNNTNTVQTPSVFSQVAQGASAVGSALLM